jgi:hypothetical protein
MTVKEKEMANDQINRFIFASRAKLKNSAAPATSTRF